MPERFSPDPKITGTSQLIDQHYQSTAGCEAERLRLSLGGNGADDIEGLVTVPMALCWMPIVLDLETQPIMVPRSWVTFGRFASLMTSLNLDDAVWFMGVARYEVESVLFGRMYVLVMRRRRFVWKAALSFMTACLPGTTEAMLERNDHVRAGAILGYLELDAADKDRKIPLHQMAAQTGNNIGAKDSVNSADKKREDSTSSGTSPDRE